MKKKTVAELRENAVLELVTRKTESPTAQDIADARRVMNSFYRLCGLRETLLMLENTESTCNRLSTMELLERENRRYDRLKGIFETEYNATLVCFGYLPTICEMRDGHPHDLYLRHFYQN